ncbi:glutathione synthetase ATP-binding domain-like protein [Annulohypoxylon moriforme]|nr:glutathione synthetase ATP-binding domain-like protein [Annulohypoxylon moriforme]
MPGLDFLREVLFRGKRTPVRPRTMHTLLGLYSWDRQPSDFRRSHSNMPNQTSTRPCVAVLYQALDPPIIRGVTKPKKPGGYQDSGADIAYALKSCSDIDVTSPLPLPDPPKDAGWCFPDTEDGILEAIRKGATHLWANTILFASHPLQTSDKLETYLDSVQVVGQGPLAVERYDDKQYVNDLLRQLDEFTMPQAWCIDDSQDIAAKLDYVSYPIVAKPVRGRGSEGVKVCYDPDELIAHARTLLDHSSSIMLEEFLEGEEITITVMPPSQREPKYWSLPVVTRFNHQHGIAPYNGTVAVTANSRALSQSEHDQFHIRAMRECERVAQVLGVTAPIRIDARRAMDSENSAFVLFDINMKPNMTGPGRPGRDDQASLTLMAASALGWSYQDLLCCILNNSLTLRCLRSLKPREIF